MIIMSRPTALLVALTLIVSACARDTASPSSTVDPASPTITTTSTTVPATTTITAEEPGLAPPDPFSITTDDAAGSGCRPGQDRLPTGIWFGLMTDVGDSTIEFDLACFYTGEAAWEKAAEEGEEANNDFWIVNENPSMRTLEVASGATIWVIAENVSAAPHPMPFTAWGPDMSAYTPCPGDGCTVWVEITNGVVTEIVEQYLP